MNLLSTIQPNVMVYFSAPSTVQKQVDIFVAIDHLSTDCVGRGTSIKELETIHQGVNEHLGAIAKDIATGLTICHDNGSQYISRAFAA